MHLFKAFTNSSSKATQAASDAHTDHQQPLVLEPILTPSGLPLDMDIENDEISTDRVELFIFDAADSDLDQPSGSDPLESKGDVLGEAAPLSGEEGDWIAPGFLDPEVIGFESGMFIVGNTGEVTIDYLFDGGGYKGELAIFSLDGMDLPGTDDFVQEDFTREAARRALSNSDQGHIAIRDRAEGARFSDKMPGEGDFNGGDYLGAKTFQMRPGDEVGFMLVPNGRVQQVFDNPAIGGAKTPLFSLSTANPNGMFHTGQIADVFGDGQTFVFEDLRTDGTSDLDYNDLIFQVRGATGTAIRPLEFIDNANDDWRTTDMGKAIATYSNAYLSEDFPVVLPLLESAREAQPLIGIVDTGFSANNPDIDYGRLLLGKDRINGDDNPLLAPGEGSEHGTHTLGIIGATQDNGVGIDGLNDDAPIWIGRSVGSGQWAESLAEFVDAFVDSDQPNAVVNLSLDLTQLNPDGTVATRYEFTPAERAAIELARQHNVLLVVAAGNDGDVMSALGQASQEFDNIITVGAADNLIRAPYSSFGPGLDVLAPGGSEDNGILSTVGDDLASMAGTSVATAQVTGAISQVWAANPSLSYRQVIDIIKQTAQDLGTPNWDVETGAGLLNMAAAVHLAKVTLPVPHQAPASLIPDTWSGEGRVIPLERAARTPYIFRSGDNLWNLAAQYLGNPTRWPEITKADGTSYTSAEAQQILPGTVVYLPIGNPNSTPPAQVGEQQKYIVKAGDSLWSIAQRYLGNGSRWREIRKANGSAFTDAEVRQLRIGQAVYLPVSYRPGGGRPVTPTPTPAPKPPSNITWVNFSGTVGPRIGINLRYSQQLSNRSGRNEPYGKRLEFDAWATGQTVTDLWLGTPDSRWFKVKGTNLWVPSAYIWGNPPGSNPTPTPVPPGGNGQRILDAVNRVNPDQRYYQPRDITGDGRNETFCNWFVADVLEVLGVPIRRHNQPMYPPVFGGQARQKPLSAEQLNTFFRNGGGGKWQIVNAATAAAKANSGQTVLASSYGHIAMVIPGSSSTNVRIAQAGARNSKNMSVSEGFGRQLASIIYVAYTG
jgi:nucleoid-associated protein YgaU